MVNWTFVYKNYEGLIGQPGGPADEEQFERPRLRALPADASRARTRSRPIGGIDIGVGAYSEHPEFAMEAAQCITSTEAQVDLALDRRADAVDQHRVRRGRRPAVTSPRT